MNRRSVLLLLATLVAIIGTALVVVYVRSADNRARAEFDTVEVLVATQTIEAGESIEDAAASGKVESKPVPKNQVLVDAVESTESLDGQVAVTTIYAGEQLIPAKFGGAVEGTSLAIPDGMQAISVELSDPYRVAGFVNPGDEVAIYYLPNSDVEASKNIPDRVRLLLKRVLVIGVGSSSTTTKKTTVDATGQETVQDIPQTLLTIAVSQQDAEKVLWAEDEPYDHGEIAFALLTDDSKVSYGRGTAQDNLYY